LGIEAETRNGFVWEDVTRTACAVLSPTSAINLQSFFERSVNETVILRMREHAIRKPIESACEPGATTGDVNGRVQGIAARPSMPQANKSKSMNDDSPVEIAAGKYRASNSRSAGLRLLSYSAAPQSADRIEPFQLRAF
jgi:hypothetical protein